MDHPTGDPLDELVASCLSRIESDGPGAVDALCAEHPEQATALRRRLELLRGMGLHQPEPLRVPEQLGAFRLGPVLGVGGMGVVYRAVEQGLGREVALKIVRPEQLLFPGARERFQREVETVARLAHPGIVPVYSVGEEQGIPYLAMAAIDGCTLAQVLERARDADPRGLTGRDFARFVGQAARAAQARGARDGAGAGDGDGDGDAHVDDVARGGDSVSDDGAGGYLFSGTWEQTCLRVVAHVAEALEHAHRRGVLHRDIKPSNVMITAGDAEQGGSSRVLLMDFGLATSGEATPITRSGSHLGSLPYMSPEQTRGEGELGPRADVYSLGVTLFELLALQPAFGQTSDTELLERIRRGHDGPPSRFNPSVSWEADTVCLTAMDTDPSRRYASAADLHRDLLNVLEHRPIEARRAGALLRARRWAQRRPAAAVGLVLGTLLVLGAPTLWAVQEARANLRLRESKDRIDQQNTALEVANQEVQRSNAELRDANLAVGAANADLAAALDLAEQRRDLAERQRARAETNFGQALAAVDRMLARVGEERLEFVPGMQPLREELLLDAAAFYDELLQQKPEAGELLRERSRLGRARGDVLALLGRYDEALDAYEVEIAALEPLARAAPDDFNLTYTLAGCHAQIGQVLVGASLYERALPSLERAIALLEQLALVVPDHWGVTHDLAVNLSNRALVHDNLGPLESAAADQTRGLELLRALPPGAADEREVQALVANMTSSLAHTESRLGREAQGEAHFREALGLHRALVAAEPEHPRHRNDLMRVCNNFSLLLERRGEKRLRGELLEEGYACALWLVERDPDVVGYEQSVAILSTNLGGLYGAQARYDEALPWFERALETVERLVAAEPRVDLVAHQGALLANLSFTRSRLGDPELGLELAERAGVVLGQARAALPNKAAFDEHEAFRRIAMGEATARLGDHEGAAAWQEQVPALCRYSPGLLVSMAEVLALCAEVAADDEALSADDRSRFAAAYREVTLAVLTAAVDGGLSSREDLTQSAALAGLAGEAAFDALVERIPPASP